jgi:hypothetical protein
VVSKITLRLRKNRDGTYTVRVGRAVEHVSTEGKTRGQVFDAIKYAAMSKGVYLKDVDLVDLMTRNEITIDNR